MKKFILLSTAFLLVSGVSFAHDKGREKGKDKPKKEKSAAKTCPGKECGKKKS